MAAIIARLEQGNSTQTGHRLWADTIGRNVSEVNTPRYFQVYTGTPETIRLNFLVPASASAAIACLNGAVARNAIQTASAILADVSVNAHSPVIDDLRD